MTSATARPARWGTRDNSNVGVRLWAARLRIFQAAWEVAAAAGRPAWEWAIASGQDYELCFTAPSEVAEIIAPQVQEAIGTQFIVVGEALRPDEGCRLALADGRGTP